MAIPAARVETRIVLEGTDNASKAIRSAHDSANALSHGVHGMGESFTEAGESAVGFGGKLGHLARPMASFGGVFKGDIREAGHGLHLLHAAAELLPGPLGLIAAGAAAAGVAFALWHEHEKEELKERAKELGEELKEQKEDVHWMARHLSLSEEMLGVTEKEANAKDRLKKVVEESKKLAGQMVDDEIKLAAAKAEGNDKEETSITKRLTLRDSELSKLRTEYAVVKQMVEVEQTRTDMASEYAKNFKARMEDADNLMNKRERLDAKANLLAETRKNLERDIGLAKLNAKQYDEEQLSKANAEFRDRKRSLEKEERKLSDEYKPDPKKGGKGETPAEKRKKDAAELSKAIDAEMKATDEAMKARDEEDANRRKQRRAADDADHALQMAQVDADIKNAQNAHDNDKVRQLERVKAELEADQKIIEIKRESFDQENKLNGEALDNFKHAQEARTEAVKMGAETKVSGMDTKRFQEDMARANSIMSKSIATLEHTGSAGGKAMATMAQGAIRVAQGWKSMKESSGDAVSAVGEVAASVVSSEKEKATILAITEAAAALVCIYYEDYKGAALHAGAAALYGMAAGTSGGSSGASASGGGGGGSYNAPTAYSGGTGNPGQGGTVNHYYGVLGTQQEAALMRQRADATLKNTGFSRAKGV